MGAGEPGDEPPPPTGSWARLYLLVVGALAVEIILLGLVTVAFRG